MGIKQTDEYSDLVFTVTALRLHKQVVLVQQDQKADASYFVSVAKRQREVAIDAQAGEWVNMHQRQVCQIVSCIKPSVHKLVGRTAKIPVTVNTHKVFARSLRCCCGIPHSGKLM